MRTSIVLIVTLGFGLLAGCATTNHRPGEATLEQAREASYRAHTRQNQRAERNNRRTDAMVVGGAIGGLLGVIAAGANDDEHRGEPGAARAERAERRKKAMIGTGIGVVAGWILSD